MVVNHLISIRPKKYVIESIFYWTIAQVYSSPRCFQQLGLEQNAPPNIMIVDDEQDILLTYDSILRGEGYNVETFSNPHDALLHFIHADKSYYDLVILDIRMPNLNGLQLYHRLKAVDKDIKIFFLSALEASKEIASIYPELKHGDIVKKPIEKEYFVEKINKLLH
jgi:CheY-like chemotaxis protein